MPHSDVSLSNPPTLDLASLAANLQGALSVLSHFIQDQSPEADKDTQETCQTGERRTYALCPGGLELEKECLARYGEQEIFAQFFSLLSNLTFIVTLMEQIEDSRRLPEDFIQSLAQFIKGPLDGLDMVAGVFMEMRLVSVVKVPEQ